MSGLAPVIGHEDVRGALATAARNGELTNALLLHGPPGIGKATLAYRFARWLLAGATSPDLSLDPANPVFRRIAAGAHADLLVIERLFDHQQVEFIQLFQMRQVLNPIRRVRIDREQDVRMTLPHFPHDIDIPTGLDL